MSPAHASGTDIMLPLSLQIKAFRTIREKKMGYTFEKTSVRPFVAFDLALSVHVPCGLTAPDLFSLQLRQNLLALRSRRLKIPYHVEGSLGQIISFSTHDGLEAANGIF